MKATYTSVDNRVMSFHIGNNYFSSTPTQSGWLVNRIPDCAGETEFLTGKICQDISITRSKCYFSHDCQTSIQYPSSTLLLVFGISGYSNFGFSSKQPNKTIRPGDVWLINTKKELFRRTPADQKNEMLVIKYSTQRIYQATQNCDENYADLTENIMLRLGHQDTNHLQLNSLINNPLATAVDHLIAEAQALELLARWLIPLSTKPNSDTQVLSLEKQKLKQIVEYLTSDLAFTPSLENLAKQANMCHTQLNRQFKKAYGATIFCWLRTYRLERARAYLKDKNRNITDIAFQCGFSSASHFAQAFKSHYGCSPREFRKSQ